MAQFDRFNRPTLLRRGDEVTICFMRHDLRGKFMNNCEGANHEVFQVLGIFDRHSFCRKIYGEDSDVEMDQGWPQIKDGCGYQSLTMLVNTLLDMEEKWLQSLTPLNEYQLKVFQAIQGLPKQFQSTTTNLIFALEGWHCPTSLAALEAGKRSPSYVMKTTRKNLKAWFKKILNMKLF